MEITGVEIPEAMQRAMAREAEAERERRAKIISARGELQASEQLRQAADTRRVRSSCPPRGLRFRGSVTAHSAEDGASWSAQPGWQPNLR